MLLIRYPEDTAVQFVSNGTFTCRTHERSRECSSVGGEFQKVGRHPTSSVET